MKAGLVVVFLCFLAFAGRGKAISFRLEPEVRKCVKEEVHKDVLVVGEYRLSEVAGQKTDLVVSWEGGRETARAAGSGICVPNSAHH